MSYVCRVMEEAIDATKTKRNKLIAETELEIKEKVILIEIIETEEKSLEICTN